MCDRECKCKNCVFGPCNAYCDYSEELLEQCRNGAIKKCDMFIRRRSTICKAIAEWIHEKFK